jgi:hypothetical protein
MSITLSIFVGILSSIYCFSVIAFLFYYLSNQEEGYLELLVLTRVIRLSFLSPHELYSKTDLWDTHNSQETHQWSDNGWDPIPELIETETYYTTPMLQEAGEQLAKKLAAQLLQELKN